MKTTVTPAQIRLFRNLLDILIKNKGGEPEDYTLYYFINLKDEEKLVIQNIKDPTTYVYKGLYNYTDRIQRKLSLYYVPILTIPDLAMIPKKAYNATEEVLKQLPYPFPGIPDCYDPTTDRFFEGPPFPYTPAPNKEKP